MLHILSAQQESVDIWDICHHSGMLCQHEGKWSVSKWRSWDLNASPARADCTLSHLETLLELRPRAGTLALRFLSAACLPAWERVSRSGPEIVGRSGCLCLGNRGTGLPTCFFPPHKHSLRTFLPIPSSAGRCGYSKSKQTHYLSSWSSWSTC